MSGAPTRAERMACRIFGEGPPVVLLHGIPGSAAIWTSIARELEDAFRVIVPDLVGFGDSPRPHPALWAHDQARVLADELDELGVERATIVGHDFGGPVAFALWERRPDLFGSLVVGATNAFGDTPIPFPLSMVVLPLVGSMFARVLFSPVALRMMLKQGVAADGVKLDPDGYVGDAAQARTVREIFHGSLVQLEERYGPFEATLASIDVPTTVVWGDKDVFFPLEHGRRTAAAIPGSRFVVYTDTGHFIPEERPMELAREIAEVARGTDDFRLEQMSNQT